MIRRNRRLIETVLPTSVMNGLKLSTRIGAPGDHRPSSQSSKTVLSTVHDGGLIKLCTAVQPRLDEVMA